MLGDVLEVAIREYYEREKANKDAVAVRFQLCADLAASLHECIEAVLIKISILFLDITYSPRSFFSNGSDVIRSSRC